MNEKKYFKRLDFIRILSCIAVLLYHLNILKGGYLAVCTFFALSGYLSLTSAANKNKFSLKEYYIKKIKNIYIPLLIVASITVILAKFIPSINWINLKQETTSVLLGYNNFWQLSANLDYFTRHVNSPFMHFWYISILMQFDLIFPFVFMLFRKIDKKINKSLSTLFISLLTIASTAFFYYMSKTQDLMIVYYNTFARSFSIMFGVLLALIHFKYEIKLPKIMKSLNGIIYYIYFLALIALCIFVKDSSSHYAIFMILASIISVRLIRYSVIPKRRKEKEGILDKIIKFFAKCSYEIYLVQYPVIFFMQNIEIGEKLKVLITILITLILSIILNLLTNSIKKSKVLKILRSVFLGIIILLGIVIVIIEEDHTIEMKELEELLNQNAKMIEERMSENKNKAIEENEKWLLALKTFDDDEKKAAEEVRNLPVVGIGDSVLLGAINGLYDKFPNGYFDGKVSRSIIKSRDLFVELKNGGKLTDTIIIALSNNSDFFEWTFTDLLELLGDRQIYWITATYADDPKFNEKFKVFAKDYPNIHIVDWEEKSVGHPEYFYADGIHLKEEGITAYANVIYDAIFEDHVKEYRIKKENALKEHEDKQKQKIAFYGNDVLTNAYSYLSEKFENASFVANSEYSFDSLYNELEEKIEKETLEYKIVLVFDKEANISNDDYSKIVNLCKDYKLYICNMTEEKISFEEENVRVIDFYSQIKDNNEYLMADKLHLSEKGNIALVEAIDVEVNN